MEKLSVAKGVTLVLDVFPGNGDGDRMRLRQVLLILLDNALRFTPGGGSIHLDARVQGSEALIRISDNGEGIPAEHLGHIFERFHQVPGQPSEGRGNGLGLAIAQGIVHAHGGRITGAEQGR